MNGFENPKKLRGKILAFGVFVSLLILPPVRNATVGTVSRIPTSTLTTDLTLDLKPEEVDFLFKNFNPKTRKVILNSITQVNGTRRMRGTWTGGGGGVILCYRNSSDATEAVRGGVLTEFGRSNMTSIEALDYFQFKKRMNFYEPKTDELPQDYLQRVLEIYLGRLSPGFSKKLQRALAKVNVESFRDRRDLPVIQDTGTIFIQDIESENPNCRYVQLAIRLTQSVGSGEMPPVLVGYDEDLYRKLSTMAKNQRVAVINQAIFLLHEALYYLGFELGHTDSSSSRSFANLLLSQDVFNETMEMSRSESDRIKIFRKQLVLFGFDDFPELFVGDEKDPAAVKRFSKTQRRRDYESYKTKVSEGVKRFLVEKNFSVRDVAISTENQWKLVEHLAKFVYPGFSEGEAFSVVVESAFGLGVVSNIEVFREDGVDDSVELNAVCKYAEEKIAKIAEDSEGEPNAKTVGDLFILQQARAYCSKSREP